MMRTTNFLVIGSGVAGLSLAIKLAEKLPDKHITVVTKSNQEESNTKYAQGGIAVVTHTEDSYRKHIKDTLICGDGLCNKQVVKMVIKDGPERLRELIRWGAEFDKNSKNELDLGKEGGHSDHRVVHHKDRTGYEIEKTVLAQAGKQKNIDILDYHFALELIVEENQCLGAYVLNEKTSETLMITSDYTVLATGGIGQVYGHTTNPKIATGDGIAMAFRAKAEIRDMEFVQFHPTALYSENTDTTFLISEAVRGFGAYLKNKKGERFIFKYDTRGELASRDIVSQSIDMELKQSGESCVYIDCTHLDKKSLLNHFPMIYEQCYTLGIDLTKDWIPIAPSQHYICGGIMVNQNGQTSIERLFACGECSRTGLHGANRLASNSLLEALVYSDRIYRYLTENYTKSQKTAKFLLHKNPKTQSISNEFILKRKSEVQAIMLKNVGIVRTDNELRFAKNQLSKWQEELREIGERQDVTKDFYELKNCIDVGLLIVEHSLLRTQNKGAFLKISPQIST
ncbi:MAG: L-aspartate oxidase [Flavobacteriaceae bacterium]